MFEPGVLNVGVFDKLMHKVGLCKTLLYKAGAIQLWMFVIWTSWPYLGGVYLGRALDGGELCDDAEDAVEGRLLEAGLLEEVHDG